MGQRFFWAAILVFGPVLGMAKSNPLVDCEDARRKYEARLDFCRQVFELRGPAAGQLCMASARPVPASCGPTPADR